MGFGYPEGRARRADRVRPRDVLPAADQRPALPVGLRPPGPARPGRDARAGDRRLADVHAEDAPRPAGAGPPAAAAWAAIDAGEWDDVRAAAAPLPALHRRRRDAARPDARAGAPAHATRHRSRPPRWRSATGSCIGGCASDRLRTPPGWVTPLTFSVYGANCWTSSVGSSVATIATTLSNGIAASRSRRSSERWLRPFHSTCSTVGTLPARMPTSLTFQFCDRAAGGSASAS